MIRNLAIIFFFVAFKTWSQEVSEPAKENCLLLNVSLNQIKEENLHPKVHAGLLYGLTYGRIRGNKNSSAIDISLQYSRLKTKYEDLSASINIQLNAAYSRLFEIIKGPDYNFNSGPTMRLDYNLSYYPNWDDSHPYWANYLSLGIGNRFRYSFNEKRSLTVQAKFPLIAAFSRPQLDRQYKIEDVSFGGIMSSLHSDIEAGTVNKVFYLITSAEYHIQVSTRVKQAICYSYNYAKIKKSDGLSFRNNQHSIGFKVFF